MPTVTRTARTSAPRTTVHAYLRDFANAEEWDAGTISCTPVDDTPVGEGKQWTNVSEFRGRETTLTYTLETDRPDHLRIVGRNKTVTSEDDLELADGDDGGTVVTYTAVFTFHGLAKIATPLLVPALGQLADDAQATLEEAIAKLPTS